MLDRFETLARGKQDVGHCHIVLEIDELLRPTCGGLGIPDEPERLQRAFLHIRHFRCDGALCSGETSNPCRLGACVHGKLQGLCERELSRRSPHTHFRLHGLAGYKTRLCIVPLRLPARLCEEVQDRTEASRCRDDIAGQRLDLSADLPALVGRHIGR